MSTPMEKRNNRLIGEFLDGKQDALLWASRVSGLNLDDIIAECLRIGWEGFSTELEFLETAPEAAEGEE